MSLLNYITDRIDVAESFEDTATIYYIISSLKINDMHQTMLWASENGKRITMQCFIRYFDSETTHTAPLCIKAAYDRNYHGIVSDMLENDEYIKIILTNKLTEKIALIYFRQKKIERLKRIKRDTLDNR